MTYFCILYHISKKIQQFFIATEGVAFCNTLLILLNLDNPDLIHFIR